MCVHGGLRKQNNKEVGEKNDRQKSGARQQAAGARAQATRRLRTMMFSPCRRCIKAGSVCNELMRRRYVSQVASAFATNAKIKKDSDAAPAE